MLQLEMASMDSLGIKLEFEKKKKNRQDYREEAFFFSFNFWERREKRKINNVENNLTCFNLI